MIHSYSDFQPLHENVQWAKSFLAKQGIPLTDEAYQTIRTILEKTPGWVGVFVRFHYEENVSIEDLATLYDTRTALGTTLRNLPKPVDKYDHYEKLCDDLEKLESRTKANKIYQEMPAALKTQYKDMVGTPVETNFLNLAVEFAKLPEPMQRSWFRKISGFKMLGFLFRDLTEYVNASASGWSFHGVLEQVNSTTGARVAYQNEEQQVLVVQLETYEANVALNAGTQWCIRNSESNWVRYVSELAETRQFTIYNFNLPASDRQSMVGTTVNAGNVPTATHYKDDEPMSAPKLKAYLAELGVGDALNDTTPVEERKKRIIAMILHEDEPGETANKLYRFLSGRQTSRDSTSLTLYKSEVIAAVLDAVEDEQIGSLTNWLKSYYNSNACFVNAKVAPVYAHILRRVLDMMKTVSDQKPSMKPSQALPLVELYSMLSPKHDPAILDYAVELCKSHPHNYIWLVRAVVDSTTAKRRDQDVDYIISKDVPDEEFRLSEYFFKSKQYDRALQMLRKQEVITNNNRNGGRWNVVESITDHFDADVLDALLSAPDLPVMREFFRRNAKFGDGWNFKPNYKGHGAKLMACVRVLMKHKFFPRYITNITGSLAQIKTPEAKALIQEFLDVAPERVEEALTTKFSRFQ